MKYLFGPVNSRRLGLSLGVDLLPAKICTLNCVYCECGGTTDLTTEIREYVPTREVIAELDSFLADSPPLDAITFSGSGEPTLHSGLGDIVRYLKNTYPRYRVVLLTNGTLFWREDVRRAAAGCDIVIPSLDAVTPAAFNAVARPAPEITPDRVVEGLSAFRKEFAGRLIIEIFIVPGVNDGEDEIRLMRDACLSIRPDLVQLNTLDRPGAERWVVPADRSMLESIASRFSPVPAEVVGKPAEGDRAIDRRYDMAESIIATLRRRPSTIDDLSAALGAESAEVSRVINEMIKKRKVVAERRDRGIFYRLASSITRGE